MNLAPPQASPKAQWKKKLGGLHGLTRLKAAMLDVMVYAISRRGVKFVPLDVYKATELAHRTVRSALVALVKLDALAYLPGESPRYWLPALNPDELVRDEEARFWENHCEDLNFFTDDDGF